MRPVGAALLAYIDDCSETAGMIALEAPVRQRHTRRMLALGTAEGVTLCAPSFNARCASASLRLKTARVPRPGKVSISACPAGTTGKFALVARVRDEAGAITPIEFSEMWQSADAEDYIFYADYPIGDNVFLMGVRVRNLTCTCEGPTP